MKYLPENIDKIDQKILITLDMDARMPLSRLAKICKISRDKVNYRINRLLQKNILGGFYTLIDIERLGYANYVVFLKIKNKEDEIVSYLKNNSHVNWLVNAEMQWDIVTWIAAKDQFTFIKFWKEFSERFENSLINAEIAILGSLVHYKRHFFTNEKNEDEIVVFGGRERREIDDKDMEILRAISFDARIKLLDLAKKVNLNFKTLQKRIRMLEKEQIIIGYRTYLNYSEIGYNYYLILLRLSNINKEILNKIRSYVKLDPYIDVSWQLIGKANMAIHIKAKNDKHLREVFNSFKNKFQDYIIDYETLLLYKQHKFVSFPS